MDFTKMLSLLVVSVLLVLQKGILVDGIRCYFCMGRGCRDDFDFSSSYVTIHDCGPGQCTKNKGPDGTVARACTPIKLANDGCMETGDLQAVCACSGDLCNLATPVYSSIATVVIATTGVIVGKWLL